MDDKITLTREQLAKFMAFCGNTIVSMAISKPITKETLEASYLAHMKPGYIEATLKGIEEDFDRFQNQGQKSVINDEDILNFLTDKKGE